MAVTTPPVGMAATKVKRHSSALRQRVAINIGTTDVKWVLARENQGQVTIEQLRCRKLTGSVDTEVSNFLSACFDEFRSVKREAICCISSNAFISKNVDMPSNDPQEINKIVNLHAGRYTPYAREEIIIDYLSSQAPEQHYTNVLLVIINRTVSSRMFGIFADANIHLEKIVIGAEAVASVCPAWLKLPGAGSAAGVINVDADTSDVIIADRGQMVFVRNIPIGARQLRQKDARISSEFMNEVKQSFATYQDQGIGRMVERVLLTGILTDNTDFEGEMRGLMHQISVENIQLKTQSYLECFTLSREASLRVAADSDSCFLDVFAVLTRNDALKIDLIPDEIKLQRQMREGSKDVISLGILIMTFLLIFCVFLATKIYLKTAKIAMIDAMEQSTGAAARSLENASTKTRVLRELLGARGKGLYVFDKLTSMITDDIYLSTFSFDRDGAITFTGTADSMSRVFAFVTTLEESPLFKNVETKQTKTRKEQGKEVADFEISCTFVDMEK
jgi:Tfp pilus assembly PilM family ATPase